MIRVMLVDDQTLIRQGIRSLLELTKDIQVVAEAEDGETALHTLRKMSAPERPEVLLLDVRMPKKTGLEVLSQLPMLTTLGDTPLAAILLTTFDDDAVALEGIRLGARGFLLKDVSLEQLTEAIRTVAGGGTLFSPAITDRVLRGLPRLGLDPRGAPAFSASETPDAMTKRELEVLRLLASGANNREIALALGAAEGTIKNHVSNVLSKLGVRDRTRAVLRALELGII